MITKGDSTLLECTHCNNKVLSNIKWNYAKNRRLTEKELHEEGYYEKDNYREVIDSESFYGLDENTLWYLLECTTCNQLTLSKK